MEISLTSDHNVINRFYRLTVAVTLYATLTSLITDLWHMWIEFNSSVYGLHSIHLCCT